MKIKDKKVAMKKYIDFFGGDLVEVSKVDSAKTNKELKAIIETHKRHMEDMLSDAVSHIESFQKKIDLFY